MGEYAEQLINGDCDFFTGEYIGRGKGFPRTQNGSLFNQRKSEDLSWKKVTGLLNNSGIKQHLHPKVLQDYGCIYVGKTPLRNACFEVLKDFEKFKIFIQEYKIN